MVVGLSGGVDSVVLLDLMQRAAGGRFELSALHINHQINPQADRWSAFCRALCRERGIPCKAVRVNVPRGASLEAAAREARYRIFESMSAGLIVLGHNLDDQVETVLLQLLRGAGVRGLSAMPELRYKARPSSGEAAVSHAKPRRTPPGIFRPLLTVTRDEIMTYAHRRGLRWIEDDSNADTVYDRNFMRHQVLPLIAQRYPAYRTTLARASYNLAEAAQLLQELAALDAQVTAEALSLAELQRLSPMRAKNALRSFLTHRGLRMPSAARLEECVRQLLKAAPSAKSVADFGSYELRTHAGRLRVVAKTEALPPGLCWQWQGEHSLRLEELGGTLSFKPRRGSGISRQKLAGHALSVRLRQGGESLQPDSGRPKRTLKNLLQEASVPAWQRSRLPLIFSGETLVYAPGIGIDAEFRAGRGEVGLEPHWELD